MKTLRSIWHDLRRSAADGSAFFVIALAVVAFVVGGALGRMDVAPVGSDQDAAAVPSTTPSATPSASLAVVVASDAATPDRTVTVTATATVTKTVTKKVYVTRTAQPASRDYTRAPGVGKPGYGWELGGVTDLPFALCVAKHESWDWPAWKGNYGQTVWDAENAYSTASGAFQFIDGTWQHYAQMLGYNYKHASDAPPAVQGKVMRLVIKRGETYHWKGTGC